MHSKIFAALIMLAATASSSVALAASCPSSNRLQFIDMANPSNVITASSLSTARHRVAIGSVPYFYTYIDVAIITNLSTGYCSAYFLSYDGVNAVPWLTQNSNLCMGPYNDDVDNVQWPEVPAYSCNGAQVALQPMIYNGYRLHTYAGGGDDHVHLSYGTDRVYGGSGADDLLDIGGTGDRMYGETNGDQMICSEGSSTLCDGGGAGDYIYDYVGSNDSIYGGGSSDHIFACGAKTVDCGENSAAYSDSDVLYYDPYNGSQENCETVELYPDCF